MNEKATKIMSKIETNKNQKLNSLLNTAFQLFTTQGVSKTSIAEISEKAGIAKGTFYLYFKDKYDIRNRLISHESSKLFKNATAALEQHTTEIGKELPFDEKIIFVVDHIINELNENKALLNFISKNLSWGIFKEALTTHVAAEDINFKDVFYQMLEEENYAIEKPEIMLFLITELVSSTCYSAILYNEPADIETIKPFLFHAIKDIIHGHLGTSGQE